MKNVGAVLLDTRGIQRYVFASNKLKTNIGASYLVDAIFQTPVNQVLTEMGLTFPKDWRSTVPLQMTKDTTTTAEIAYIGGGNMLLFFRPLQGDAISVARQFVSRWSEKLLVYTPGLQTGAAVGEFDLDDFQNSLNRLYKALKENQANIMPQVDLPYTGVSLECDFYSKTANVFSRKAVNRYVSSEVDAKLRAADCADGRLKEIYSTILQYKGLQLKFADDFNLLGYKQGESYIAVIHIDGNNMGVKFSHCRDWKERRDLSITVANAVTTAFGELVTKIVKEYLEDHSYDKYLDLKTLLGQEDSVILPIRPIIIGGDDITFITPGRLGLHYANYFIRCANRQLLLDEEQKAHFESCANQGSEQKCNINSHLSCCAGVAIVPAKYPFFRAYTLAEELCSNAKKQSRQDDSSWLDFAVLHGETYPSLEMLRESQYKGIPSENGRDCQMHYGPYRIDVSPENKESKSLRRLFALHSKLKEAHKNSSNKIKLLRETLFNDRHSQEIFLENDYGMVKLLEKESSRNKPGSLKQIGAADLWEIENINGTDVETTRYIDAIEIDDFMITGLEGENK